MSSKWLYAAIAGVFGAAVCAGTVLATTQSGVDSKQFATKIEFDPFDVRAHTIPADRWQAMLRTHGQSEAYVVDNKFAPGGTTGWHSHPGPSLVMVVAGSVTNYSSDQPGCVGETYTAGHGFIDEGGDHVHMLRNPSGGDIAETIAVQILPKGASRRIEADPPANCPA